MAPLIHDAMLSASIRTPAGSRTALSPTSTTSTTKPAPQPEQSQRGQNNERTANNKAPTEAELQKALQQANMEFSGSNQKISFTYEKRINQMFVQVVDKTTGEVVKEVPPKEFIEHKIAMHELIGLLLDKQG